MESSKFINYLKNMCGGYPYIMIYQFELEIHFNEMFLCFYFPFSSIILHKYICGKDHPISLKTCIGFF